MQPSNQSIAGIGISVVVGTAMAVAGSHLGADVGPLPVFAACVALAFAINWIAFVPSWLARTERFYDLTGSLTYLAVTFFALVAAPFTDLRSCILAALIGIWAVRLGSFLFLRIRADGSDARFDAIKLDPLRLGMTWTLQALWVVMTACAALAAISAAESTAFGWVSTIGVIVWVIGFGIEVVADRQKSAFRAEPQNAGRFITTGLWAWSRHPNYFGEMVLWVGIALIALPALEGWRYVTLISPVFVWFLISKVSGIPMLASRARKRWGSEPAWADYTERTPSLIPRPPRRTT